MIRILMVKGKVLHWER